MKSPIIRTCSIPAVLLAILFVSSRVSIHAEQATKPNVIVILVDDLGWKDLGCSGSTFYETPSIDALAKSGTRFTHAYAPHPVCGPSRCSILTGRYPLRTKNTGVKGNLRKDEVTMAEVFKESGYKTFFAGKWHCGPSPQVQGFDEAIANNPQGQPGSHHFPYRDTGCDWPGTKRKVIKARDVPGLSDGTEGEYLTDRLTDETIDFIDQNKKAPFFVYLSHYAVHAPLESKKEYQDYFTQKRAKLPLLSTDQAYKTVNGIRFKQRQDNPVFAGMIKSLDDSVGALVKYLKANNLYDSTVILFFSDNGGIASLNKKEVDFSTSNLPSRAGKGWCYEGGTRVPLIVSFPGGAKGQKVDHPVIGMDIMPTLLELAGVPQQPDYHKDGVSFVAAMRGGKVIKRDLFWFFPQSHGSGHKPSAAIRSGQYKLIHFLKSDRVELYDLHKDAEELNDLSKEKPEVTKNLKMKIKQWQKEMK